MWVWSVCVVGGRRGGGRIPCQEGPRGPPMVRCFQFALPRASPTPCPARYNFEYVTGFVFAEDQGCGYAMGLSAAIPAVPSGWSHSFLLSAAYGMCTP